MKDEKNMEHEKEMGYLDHLSELRNRLLWSALIFLIFFVLGFFLEDKIRNFFLSHVDFTLNLISPEEILWIIITIAFIVALVGTIPFLCVQLWLFVRPGLTKDEQKVSLIYIPAIFILFIGGRSEERRV